jgi:hypothetical protein
LRQRKCKYGIQNCYSERYLEQFRKFSKYKSLDDFLHLQHDQRKKIVNAWLRSISSANTELMKVEKTLMIFTFLKRNNKLTKSMGDIIKTPRKRHITRSPI